ncbi:4-(cytidine 5'-diphospho)-2-C-methyl-D-erythritol kinase [Ilumatobacter nonamiensis]|uniref:4-(cytidine 5'-diphospho)-2-C-methyl-D-erythritol kinase n=1 Tax=Ilumatobacter nonamiensis TaxID=467093 RepID=UPI00058DF4B3|nr:4-diphosphocytidyl-2C-methyl-D-erythritol kinase [Ilumatobacter nonamiensis]
MTSPPDSSAARIRAHAKLTRTLRVVGVRDDGYHLIDAEMVSLDLHDVLTIDPAAEGVEASGPFADGVPTDRTNLVWRALDLVDRTAKVTIDKRIPHGGGLGGGSTDAAAVLHWAGFGTDPDSLRAASRVGADIPFCLVGGRARVSGIGETVEPLDPIEREITLIIPPLRMSTPDVYRAWDALGGPTSDGPNDLEPAALAVEPLMTRWRDLIAQRIGEPPVLAGSGATWFTERELTPDERDNALGDLVDEGARVVVTTTTAEPLTP